MNERYFELYKITSSQAGKIIRLFLFVFAVSFLGRIFYLHQDLKRPIAVFALVVVIELFFESLRKIKPAVKMSHDPKNISDAILFPARALIIGKNVHQIVNRMSDFSVKFFKKEMQLRKIEKAEIGKDELLKQAGELVKWVGGDYITSVDLLASYILLSEDSTHFLQNNNLNNDDVINILYWSRRKFEVDSLNESKVQLMGAGAFDSLVEAWNYELKKYAKDLTYEVLSSRFPPTIVGREKEFHELIVAISKEKFSNAIIIGEPGTGKTTLVSYLAYKSFLGDIEGGLAHKKVYELLVDKLLSGVSSAGDLEERLNNMLSDISHSAGSIVFIQNIENIFGGGGFNFDISGALMDYLKSEKIKLIGTTTPAGFANFIESKTSISSLFEKVEVNEPDGGKVMLLLTEKISEIEAKYKIKIAYSALKQVVLLSPVYYPDRFFPGRALDLLEDAAANSRSERRKTMDGKSVQDMVQSKTKVVISEPDEKEKETLLQLEEKIHKRIVGQEQAVAAVADSMRRLRSGFKNEKRPISVFLFLGPTGVGKTELAKALAAEYFGQDNPTIRLDMSEYQNQDQIRRILGETPGEEFIPNSLSALVEKQPFSLVLLDEFEKAHPQLLNIFLQVFDEGRLTNNLGKTVSFKNTIIIATSNAGTELLREKENSGQELTREELIDYLLSHNVFTPELLNRFDDIVLFKFLKQEEIAKISAMFLSESLKELELKEIKVVYDEIALSKIAKESFDPEFGGRNIRRYIEDKVENYLAKEILEDKIKKGDNVTLSVDGENNFIVV